VNRLTGAGLVAASPTPQVPDNAQVPDTQNSTAPDVYRAIYQVDREISRDGIGKDRRNEQQNYKFRGHR
jgi:hypothetical protein